MAWQIAGTYFETCSCEVVCPCTASLALGADYDRCRVTLVFNVADGDVDGTDVSGLTVAAVADTPKVMSDGNWRLGVFIDDERLGRAGGEARRRVQRPLGGADAGARAAVRRTWASSARRSRSTRRASATASRSATPSTSRSRTSSRSAWSRASRRGSAASSIPRAPSSRSRRRRARASARSASSTRARPPSPPRTSPGPPE